MNEFAVGVKRQEDLVQCYLVGDDVRNENWDAFYGPMIANALAHGPDGQTLQEVREDLQCGALLINISLNGVMAGCAVVEIEPQRELRYLHVHTLTGAGMDTWLGEFIEYLKYLRVALDCDAVSLVGRVGWHKVLQKFGWKTKHVMMQLEN